MTDVGQPLFPAPVPLKRSTERGLALASGIVFIIALLALLGEFAVYVDYAASLFRFPYDYDQGEGRPRQPGARQHNQPSELTLRQRGIRDHGRDYTPGLGATRGGSRRNSE